MKCVNLAEAVNEYREWRGVDWEKAEEAAETLYAAAQEALKALEALRERIQAKDEYREENTDEDGDWELDVAEYLTDWDSDIATDAREVIKATIGGLE